MSNVKVVRLIPVLLVAAVLPLFAGCGSTGAAGSAASVVPADVAAYVSVDTSFEGDQWRAVRELLRKFPGGEGALDEVLDGAASEAGLSAGDDLRGALGPELGIAVLDVPSGPDEDPPVVLLTRPDDEEAFQKLVAEDDAVVAEVSGWQAVAGDAATLERYRGALDGPSLQDSEAFAEAMDDLDEGALVHLYVDGGAFVRALASEQSLPPGFLGMLPGGETGSVGAAITAEDDGVRLDGRAVVAEQAETPAAEQYESELVEEVPGGVLAFVSFNGLGEALTGAGGAGLGLLGLDPAQVGSLFAGESAVYLRPGKPQPSITLVTEVEDEAEALQTVEGLVGLAQDAQGLVIAYDAFDGLLVVSTSQAEIDALRADGPRLDQDDAFEEAAESAGLPDETTGFGYVDLQAAVPLFLGLADPAGAEAAEVSEYLEPLGSVVFWGGGAGETQRFSVFLGID
jgi:hypothetical protein